MNDMKKKSHTHEKTDIQVSHSFKLLDKDLLLKQQQALEKKYGLRPHKRLRTEYIYLHNDTCSSELQNTEASGGMYQ